MRVSPAIRFMAAAAFFLAASAARAGPHIVVDVESGAVLSHEQAFQRWYPASLTKMMTIHVVLRAFEEGEIAPDSPVKLSKAAAAQPASKMYWGPGTVLTFDTAIKIMAVKSANDVTMAVAESLAGSVEGFAERMNAEAARLGMRDTHFVNANGLHARDQYSTARDMAVLAAAIRRDMPQHAHYFAIEGISYAKEDFTNYNILLGRFAGADGMKTGFVCASGFNLAASATRGGRTLVAVVLGAQSQQQRAEQAADLMALGFDKREPTNITLKTLAPYGDNREAATDMRSEVCTAEARASRWDGRQVEGKVSFATPHITALAREPDFERITIGGANGPIAPNTGALFFAGVPLPTPRPPYQTPVVESDTDLVAAGQAAPAGVPIPTPRAASVVN